MEHKCPKCGSVIYSQRNVLCGVCGERLPPELLFTAEQRKAVESDLADAKRRVREARRRDSTGTDPFAGDSINGADFEDVP